MAAACDDGYIKIYQEATGKQEINTKAHEDAVQAIAFDYNSKLLVSVGSDCSVNVWN